MQAVENIRAKIKRRFSHKDPNPDFDTYDEADEETSTYLESQIDEAEKGDEPMGKQGSLLNRMIAHGNKKTEDQIARESEEAEKAEAAKRAASSGAGQST